MCRNLYFWLLHLMKNCPWACLSRKFIGCVIYNSSVDDHSRPRRFSPKIQPINGEARLISEVIKIAPPEKLKSIYLRELVNRKFFKNFSPSYILWESIIFRTKASILVQKWVFIATPLSQHPRIIHYPILCVGRLNGRWRDIPNWTSSYKAWKNLFADWFRVAIHNARLDQGRG